MAGKSLFTFGIVIQLLYSMKRKTILLLMLASLSVQNQYVRAQSFNKDVYNAVQPQQQKLEPLPFGAIKPTGWLKAQMQQDMDGFVGNLDKLVPDLMADKIYGADRLTKEHRAKNLGNIGPEMDPQYLWWNSETQSNWRDGFIRNAILLNDTTNLAKTESYINYILSTQDDDGYIGIYSPDLRYNFKDENGELWAKTTALRGLLAWYEYTQKPEILNAIAKAVDNVMTSYPINASSPFKSAKPFAGGVTHGLVFTDVLDRLYQLTGKEKYINYALFLYKNFSENVLAEDAQFAKIMNPAYRLKEHGVHTYEQLRPLALAYFTTGNPKLKIALDVYLKRISDCTNPSGGPVGDEWIGERMAEATHTGYEYCSLHELLDGYTSLMQKSGNARFGDLAEHLFFNAAQGARLPGKSAMAYCKTDNSFEMTGTRNGEKQGSEKQTRYKYSPAHQDVAVCCAPNAGRIYPYFVKSMWMKDNNDLVSTLLGPCEVQTEIKGVKVKVTEQTEYPFSNSVTYHFAAEKPVSFTLKIRKPEWTKSFKLNCSYILKDGYILISKNWKENESIQLVLTSESQLKQNRNNENFYTFGPLVYALPIESREIITKKYAVEGLNDYQYEPVNLVKYRLPNTGKPTVTLKQNANPSTVWNSVELETRLLNEKTGIPESVKLVPLGATILRQVTFKYQVQVSSGIIKRIENIPSAFVGARNIDIWLPADYTPKKKYSVLYMHDGQMLFDSTINWNHQEWGVDETLGKLISQGKAKDCIVVGIWNTTKRHQEYFPLKPFESLSQDQKDVVTKQLQSAGRTTEVFLPISDNYLKFIVTELKPMIDKTFSVYSDRAHTFISGSSMGGLISMYALCEYPGVFGGAACLSTHWPGTFSMDNNPVPDAFVKYLNENLPDPATHKIYFDYGDQTLDALYPPLQKKVDEVMKTRGFSEKNWATKFFHGMDHSEKSWKARFDIPLMFLLGK